MPTFLLLAACLTDIKYKKMLNIFVVAAFFIVMASHFLFGHNQVFFDAFSSLAIAIILALPMYLMKAISSGDFKIFALFGLSANVDAVIFTFIFSLIWGSLLGVVRALFNKQGDVLLSNFIKIIKLQKPEPHSLHQIPFTVALLAGWVSYVLYSGYGRVL